MDNFFGRLAFRRRRPGARHAPLLRSLFLIGIIFLLVMGMQPQFAHALPGNAPQAQAAPEAPGDWPMYQHDASHSGRTSATVYNNGPLHLQWAYAFGERVEVEVQPIVADGVIYVGVMNGEMHAIDAASGQALWIKTPGGPIPHTAAVSGGSVFFGSLDGKVYALSTATGGQQWVFPTGGPVMSAPVVVDGRVFIGSTDGTLYALDAASGDELWRVTTDAPVVSSPAVADGSVYFGSEDMRARRVDAASGAVDWSTPLYGAGMHNTHPVVSDNGQVVIFVTVKPGGSGYVPAEGYPDAPVGANPVQTWNTFYQAHPTYRTLYYLNAATGADLWNPSQQLYSPLPIPYWGLLAPILAPDGSAWFPAPAGTQDYDYGLDHDNRLFRIDLSTGATAQVAGGTNPDEFQLRQDEVGRHVFTGDDYTYTISEDLGVFKPSSGDLLPLFTNGHYSGYNFGTHMDPLSPLPDKHLWRYGGVIAMGGVPNASPPIVANGMVYYTSYGWLYAVGQQNYGYSPATSFPPRDARLEELTYPRLDAPSFEAIQDEVDQRVADLIALGPSAFPLAARWEQTDASMLNHEFSFEIYSFEADLVRVLSLTYPHLLPAQQTQLRTYLSSLVSNTLLNEDHYATVTHCLVYGEAGLQIDNVNCRVPGEIASRWWANNPNLIGLRLYALWAYADATGDWSGIQAHWNFLKGEFEDNYLDAGFCNPDPTYGFCVFERWRTGRLNLPAQIAAAHAMRQMAQHFNDTSLANQADALLQQLLDARVEMASFVAGLYDSGQRQPVPIRLDDEVLHNGDFTLYYADIMGDSTPYNAALIPYYPDLRDRDTDPEQLNWLDGDVYNVDGGIGFMYYPALSGYFPLTPELITRLRASLLDKTQYYVNSYEINNPWWWMTDLAHSNTCGGEHLYHSPTLSWSMFQVKAWVLQENWNDLLHQLPEPVSFNRQYDLYRLENLVTLLELAEPDLSLSSMTASPGVPRSGDTVEFTVQVRNIGTPFSDLISFSDSLPDGLDYVPGSLSASLGNVDDSQAPTLAWSGVLADVSVATITFQAVLDVPVGVVTPIVNTAVIQSAATGSVTVSTTLLANGWRVFLPLIAVENIP